MRPALTGWARFALVGLVLAGVVSWVGTDPFLRGLRAVESGSLAAAAAIAVVTTVCAAWRWRVIARGLGMEVPLGTATAAYYRAQFLNLALPGGVLGDVHRATSHGRAVGDMGRTARAVVWERVTGQVVQIGLVLGVVAVFPSPVHASMPVVVPALVACVTGVAVVTRLTARSRWGVLARPARAVVADVRAALGSRRACAAVTLASAVVVAGHAATFLIAARAVGVTAGPGRMLPLAMLLLLVMAVPLNVGGWGPREGAAAWLFAAAGLGAAGGVAAATAYGVMAIVASLPGAAVLLHGVVRSRRTRAARGACLPAARVGWYVRVGGRGRWPGLP